MHIRHIVAATDESVAGRRAVEAAVGLARTAGARVTVLRIMAAGSAPILPSVAELDLTGVEVGVGVGFGVPSIEICRFAEEEGSDLLVLGRKPRSQAARLLLGDTADAVARRSRVPCLFVPPTTRQLERVLAAVDGTERGMGVLRTASEFAESAGASLRLVTVETDWGEPAELAAAVPAARSQRLLGVAQTQLRQGIDVRRGHVVEQILQAVGETGCDVLAVGYHRGGPPGVLEAGSIARRLTHAAPCAVLTIPL